MHKSKLLYWGAQIGGWLVYSILVFLATYAEDGDRINLKFLLTLLVFIVSGIFLTHLMRWYFLKRDWLSFKLAPLIPRVILASVVCSFLIAGFNVGFTQIINNASKKDFSPLLFFIEVMAISVLLFLWNSIYFTYHFFQKSILQEMNNLQLQASQNEIELKNLRSQLNPHFLFNSLNSIRALIEIDPVKSKKAVTTLSNLLRNSLIIGKKPFISLEEELQIVQSYLDLEKIRFEERLSVKWEIDLTIQDFQVPPFIIQTLAENSIKHGISKRMEGGEITIRTLKSPNKVWIFVENSGKLGDSVDTGVGIENIKRRLDLQYHGSAQFAIQEIGDIVSCSIDINC